MTTMEEQPSDSHMYCQACDRWYWPDDMATDNDGNYTLDLCIQCFTGGPELMDLADVLERFGWEATDEFWRKYHTDPWVFNLANALRSTFDADYPGPPGGAIRS